MFTLKCIIIHYRDGKECLQCKTSRPATSCKVYKMAKFFSCEFLGRWIRKSSGPPERIPKWSQTTQRLRLLFLILFFVRACHESQIKTKRSRRWFDCSFTSSRQLFFPFADFCLNEFLAGLLFFFWTMKPFFSSWNTEKPKLVQEKKKKSPNPEKKRTNTLLHTLRPCAIALTLHINHRCFFFRFTVFKLSIGLFNYTSHVVCFPILSLLSLLFES